MELRKDSCIRALNLDSDFVSLDICNCLIEINPISLLYHLKKFELFKNLATVPSLIESAKNGKLIVLAISNNKYQQSSKHFFAIS